jgi:hypothetical protein
MNIFLNNICLIVFFSSFFIFLYSIGSTFINNNIYLSRFFINACALLSSILLFVFYSFQRSEGSEIFFPIYIVICAICQILVGISLSDIKSGED